MQQGGPILDSKARPHTDYHCSRLSQHGWCRIDQQQEQGQEREQQEWHRSDQAHSKAENQDETKGKEATPSAVYLRVAFQGESNEQ